MEFKDLWKQTEVINNPFLKLFDIGVVNVSNDGWVWSAPNIYKAFDEAWPDINAGLHLESWLQKQLEDGNNK